ncbi:hypothetical protein [Kocuria rosea]|uniref:hypothetical protein n=1 Tax=Kocuria rosea TaxID=1275 RepID=UPI00119F0784|nr:hypothetical protein [Kocuria rosea]
MTPRASQTLPDAHVEDDLTNLLLGMKGARVGYHQAIQTLIDASIEAAQLYTVEPPQFFKFMSMMLPELREGIRIAGMLWGMPEAMVDAEAEHIDEIVRINCVR